ncbi:MAG: glycosyltransferase family 39 protein [Pseudomonadota bacterium]
MPTNPPLFEWALWAAQRVVGVGPGGFLIVKYAALVAATASAFAVGRRLGAGFDRSVVCGLFCAGGLFLTFQIAWNYHQAFTHTTMLLAAVVAFWFALLRTVERGGVGDYIVLGAIFGLGLLSKYSFAPAGAAALLAVSSVSAARRRIMPIRAIAAAATAAVVVSPHALWILTNNADLASDAGAQLSSGARGAWRPITGVAAAVWAWLSFFAPPLIVLAALAPGGARARLAAATIGAAPSSRARTVLERAALFGFVGFLLAAALLGGGAAQERYATPFAVPGLFAIAARVVAAKPSRETVRRWGAATLAVSALVIGLRIVQGIAPRPLFCDACRQWTPYALLAQSLKAWGAGEATVAGFTDDDAGNLRRLLPEARIVSAHLPAYAPPGGHGRACWFVWREGAPPPIDPALAAHFTGQAIRTVSAPWPALRFDEARRRTDWRIVRVRDANLADALCRPR